MTAMDGQADEDNRTFGEVLTDILEGAEKIEGLPLYVISRREAVELAMTLAITEEVEQ